MYRILPFGRGHALIVGLEFAIIHYGAIGALPQDAFFKGALESILILAKM